PAELRLVGGFLVEEVEHAVAALALEIAEGASAGRDEGAVLVVDLGLGREGALAGRGAPGAEDGERVAVARCLDELRGKGERYAQSPRRRRVAEGAGKARSTVEQGDQHPAMQQPFALHSSVRTFSRIS